MGISYSGAGFTKTPLLSVFGKSVYDSTYIRPISMYINSISATGAIIAVAVFNTGTVYIQWYAIGV